MYYPSTYKQTSPFSWNPRSSFPASDGPNEAPCQTYLRSPLPRSLSLTHTYFINLICTVFQLLFTSPKLSSSFFVTGPPLSVSLSLSPSLGNSSYKNFECWRVFYTGNSETKKYCYPEWVYLYNLRIVRVRDSVIVSQMKLISLI